MFILLLTYIGCFENKLLNFPEKIFLCSVKKIKNFPPEKETRRIVYKKQKKDEKEKREKKFKSL